MRKSRLHNLEKWAKNFTTEIITETLFFIKIFDICINSQCKKKYTEVALNSYTTLLTKDFISCLI